MSDTPNRIVHKTRGDTKVMYLTHKGDFPHEWGDIVVDYDGGTGEGGNAYRLTPNRTMSGGSSYAQPIRKKGYKERIEQDENGENILIWIKDKSNPKHKKSKVVHCKREASDVYIGRPGKWGNPFRIGKDGNREEVIEKYHEWIKTQPELMSSLLELKGKTLGCWCAPKPCHGDILLELVEAIKESG